MVVLDAEDAGWGCSTRNGGQVSTSIKPSYAQLRAHHGQETAWRIRREGILFITGDTLRPRTLEFVVRDGLPYLAKPFLVEELTQTVRQVLSGRNGSGSSAAPARAPRVPAVDE